MSKLADVLMMVIIGVALFIVGVTTFMLVYPYKLIEIKQPFEVLNKSVKTGDALRVVFDYSKARSYIVTSVKTIVCDDGSIMTLDIGGRTTSLPIGRRKVISTSVIIPQGVPINTYCKVVYSATYKPNLIRVMTTSHETEKFLVTE